jgi:hypothetical protein
MESRQGCPADVACPPRQVPLSAAAVPVGLPCGRFPTARNCLGLRTRGAVHCTVSGSFPPNWALPGRAAFAVRRGVHFGRRGGFVKGVGDETGTDKLLGVGRDARR